jgi:ATP-dependent DNA helicase RecG
MGTLNIIDWCSQNGNPQPVWSQQAESVFVNFQPAILPAVPGAGEVTPEVRPVGIIKGEMGRQDLRKALGLKDEEHFRKAYLLPALEAGLIEMTIPDKPRSSKQKCRLTDRGREVLKSGNKREEDIDGHGRSV